MWNSNGHSGQKPFRSLADAWQNVSFSWCFAMRCQERSDGGRNPGVPRYQMPSRVGPTLTHPLTYQVRRKVGLLVKLCHTDDLRTIVTNDSRNDMLRFYNYKNVSSLENQSIIFASHSGKPNTICTICSLLILRLSAIRSRFIVNS